VVWNRPRLWLSKSFSSYSFNRSTLCKLCNW
jgi:hypothetical protein